MLVVGAKGFAKEVLELLNRKGNTNNLYFYDDVNVDVRGELFGKYPIIKELEAAKKIFRENSPYYTIGIGNPTLRKIIFDKFNALGGEIVSTICDSVMIGNFNVTIADGCNIMPKSILTTDISIGKVVLINQLCSIGHEVEIGDFTEICPNVSISGNCNIGKNVFIGTGAIILPNIEIGDNAIIGAGSVVTHSVSAGETVVGIPAKAKPRV